MASQCSRKLIDMCLGYLDHDLTTPLRQQLKNTLKGQCNEFNDVESLTLSSGRVLINEMLKDKGVRKKVTKLLRTKHIEVYEAALLLRQNAPLMQIVMEKNIYFINRHDCQYLGIELADPICRVTLNKRVIIEVPNTPDDRWPMHFGKFAIKNRILRIRFSIRGSDESADERQERLEALVLKIRQLDNVTALRTAGYLRRSFHFTRQTHILFQKHDDLENVPPNTKRNSMEVIFRIKD